MNRPSRTRVAALVTGVAAGILALTVVLIALRAESEGQGRTTPSPSLAVSPSPSPSPTPDRSRLDPLTLTASLDEPPVSWTELAFLPAGDAGQQIGYRPCSDCVLPVPSALAVARDGSFWIADGLKARIAHFARDGSFIEAFPAKIGSAVPDSAGSADLAFVGDRLYVLLDEGRSRVALVEPRGLGEPIIVNNEGQGLHVQALIPGQDELLVMISGAERLLGGYWAFATVDPATGQVTPSPGVRDSVGSYVNLQPVLDDPPDNFEIRRERSCRGPGTSVPAHPRGERAEDHRRGHLRPNRHPLGSRDGGEHR